MAWAWANPPLPEFLRDRGAQVVDTDELARQLVQPGQPALAEIQAEFGKEVIAPDGRLRRDELARIVFADAAARKKLEAILHPRIRERWLAQIETWRGENRALAVVVIPLLFETRAESSLQQNHLRCLFRPDTARKAASARLDAGANPAAPRRAMAGGTKNFPRRFRRLDRWRARHARAAARTHFRKALINEFTNKGGLPDSLKGPFALS